MALSETPIRLTRSLNNLHRDVMRPTDPNGPSLLRLPEHDSASINSPHLDVCNPITPNNTNLKSRRLEPQSSLPSLNDEAITSTFYSQHRRQKRSSTASLVEFLQTTGPDDLKRPIGETPCSISPNSNRKKAPGSFLLKFGVGKSVNVLKKTEEVPESPVSIKLREVTSPTIAEPQFTATGRKYYAIKVDYPFGDDSSLSTRPLLADPSADPNADTRSDLDYQAIIAMKKHHRLSSVLASDTSMEFLVDANNDVPPRSAGRYSSYPPCRSPYSLARSNSMSEIRTQSDSFLDDGSIVPGDSISLRPVQVNWTMVNDTPTVIQPISVPICHPTRQGLSLGGVRSRSSSYATTTIPESLADASDSVVSLPSVSPSQASAGTVELIESLDMLDKLRKSKASSDGGSEVSYATTRSLQQRRRAKRLAQQISSADEARRNYNKQKMKSNRSTADLKNKVLPLLPPHTKHDMHDVRKVTTAVTAALSPSVKRSSEMSNFSSRGVPGMYCAMGSLSSYSIPEDDVLSLRSGISAYRNQRREKVRDKRQKDLEDERSRKLDEAMHMLQRDVQRKKEALNRKATSSTGSQTPRQMPSIERLRTPPRTPPPIFPVSQFTLSPISTLVDCAPSGYRNKRESVERSMPSPDTGPSDSESTRPKTSNSQRTIFSSEPLTPVSSAPSSPTKTQYNCLATQPIPQLVSLPPNYPPPNPAGYRPSPTKSKISDEADRERRIAALEEQKWVLEQALRVLLNQRTANGTGGSSPLLGYLERSPALARNSP